MKKYIKSHKIIRIDGCYWCPYCIPKEKEKQVFIEENKLITESFDGGYICNHRSKYGIPYNKRDVIYNINKNIVRLDCPLEDSNNITKWIYDDSI